MTHGRRRVLVLDGDTPQALGIVRSLGHKGYVVDVGSPVESPPPQAALSRWCSGRFTYPDPATQVEAFRQAVVERVTAESYALVIPVTDWTIVPLLAVRRQVEAISALAIAKDDGLQITLSKGRTGELAERLGVPVPLTQVIRETGEAIDARLTYPLFVKSDRSKAWDAAGVGRHFPVVAAGTPHDAEARIATLLPHGPVVLQQRVEGEAVGIAALARAGKTLFTFQYRRLHEVPITGGASSYRESERRDRRLERYAQALLAALEWDGVAMLEFKRGAEGELWLIEINGRFWGSLALPLAAGVDFPGWLADAMLDGRTEFPPDYPAGVRCRNLRTEVDWLKGALRSVEKVGVGRLALDTLRMLNPRERWDTLSFADPAPGMASVRAVLQDSARVALKRSRVAMVQRRMVALQASTDGLASTLKGAQRILFVCHGNIIRSAYGAALLAREVGATVEVRSAGLFANPGRPAHGETLRRARARGLDLSGHAAAQLTEAEVTSADVVLVMEVDHYLRVRRFYGAPRRKVWLLGAAVPHGPVEIPDPVGGPTEGYDRCFDAIEAAVDAIAVGLRR